MPGFRFSRLFPMLQPALLPGSSASRRVVLRIARAKPEGVGWRMSDTTKYVALPDRPMPLPGAVNVAAPAWMPEGLTSVGQRPARPARALLPDADDDVRDIRLPIGRQTGFDLKIHAGQDIAPGAAARGERLGLVQTQYLRRPVGLPGVAHQGDRCLRQRERERERGQGSEDDEEGDRGATGEAVRDARERLNRGMPPLGDLIQSGLRAPGSGLRAPGSGLRAPGSGLRAPGSGLRAPGSGLRAPGSGLRAPGSGLRAPGSGLRAPGSGLRAPGSGLRAPGSGLRAPGSGLRAPGSGLRAPIY